LCALDCKLDDFDRSATLRANLLTVHDLGLAVMGELVPLATFVLDLLDVLAGAAILEALA
jgi:hypothetical protein